jgi:hypothetical protein
MKTSDELEFHEKGFLTVLPALLGENMHGPFSAKSAMPLEQPGPPVIQSVTGSVAGFERDSKNQKK